jgi:hypothetical protein
MLQRRLVSGLLIALFLVAFTPASVATASDQWCEDDPPIVIHTPGGALVTLYVTDSALGAQHLPAVQLASITADASPTGSGTLVHVQVLVRSDAFDGHFAIRSVVSTGPFATGTIEATASGFSGQTMAMAFTLPVA